MFFAVRCCRQGDWFKSPLPPRRGFRARRCGLQRRIDMPPFPGGGVFPSPVRPGLGPRHPVPRLGVCLLGSHQDFRAEPGATFAPGEDWLGFLVTWAFDQSAMRGGRGAAPRGMPRKARRGGASGTARGMHALHCQRGPRPSGRSVVKGRRGRAPPPAAICARGGEEARGWARCPRPRDLHVRQGGLHSGRCRGRGVRAGLGAGALRPDTAGAASGE